MRLFASKGNVVVNGKRLDEYFSVPMDRIVATEPLRLCEVGQLRASIKVSGWWQFRAGRAPSAWAWPAR